MDITSLGEIPWRSHALCTHTCVMQHSQQHKHVSKGGTADKTALCAGASLVHLGIDHRSYKHHKVSAALMLIVLTLFEVASLLPLSANLFAVVGEPSPCATCIAALGMPLIAGSRSL